MTQQEREINAKWFAKKAVQHLPLGSSVYLNGVTNDQMAAGYMVLSYLMQNNIQTAC